MFGESFEAAVICRNAPRSQNRYPHDVFPFQLCQKEGNSGHINFVDFFFRTLGRARPEYSIALPTAIAHGPKRCRYSFELRNAFTISALMKLPLKLLSFANQN